METKMGKAKNIFLAQLSTFKMMCEHKIMVLTLENALGFFFFFFFPFKIDKI